MTLPTMSGTARLTAVPDLRYSSGGVAVVKVPMAFNSRKKDDAGNWVDDQTFFITGVAFKDHAEHIAESLTKGTEVVVTGRLVTRQWQDKDDNKRSMSELLIDTVGPTLRFATASVKKMVRSGGFGATWPTDDEIPPDPWNKAVPINENAA